MTFAELTTRHILYFPKSTEVATLGADPVYGVITKELDPTMNRFELALGPLPQSASATFVYVDWADYDPTRNPGYWDYDPEYMGLGSYFRSK